MRIKIIAAFAAVALLVVAGGLWAYSAKGKAATDCCYPGSECCFPGSPCCDEGCTSAKTPSAKAKGFVCCDICPECCADCTEDQCSDECIACCIALGCDCDCCFPSGKAVKTEAPKKTAKKSCCSDGCCK